MRIAKVHSSKYSLIVMHRGLKFSVQKKLEKMKAGIFLRPKRLNSSHKYVRVRVPAIVNNDLRKCDFLEMKILLILAHPDIDSFNSAIAKCCLETLETNGHTVFFHDLYEEQFDALLPAREIPRTAELSNGLRKHCDELSSADGIIIVHPNWWGQPPAILKGWIDRVIRPGIAYEFIEGDSGEGVPVGLLKARSALVFNTSNTEPEREDKVFKDPLETIWKNCIFGLCGVQDFYRRMFSIVVTSSEEQRISWLAEVSATVNRHYPKRKMAE